MPIGFKNGTDGNLQIAIDAIGSAGSSHSFLSVTKQGISASISISTTLPLIENQNLTSSACAVVETEGNPACHVILRGANSGHNFSTEHVQKAAEGLRKAKVSDKVMIDWYASTSD